MAMRMSGMMSGLDTESIIQELVAARRTKVDAKKKEQTRIDWKQEAWKELNSKLKKLQTKYIANMRFTDAYSKKTTKVSNSNAVSIITGENAVDGVQTLSISRLAKTGYLTGGEVELKSGVDGSVSALTKLSDLEGFNLGTGDKGTFTVKSASGKVDIEITGDTTISDVLNQIKDAGLNASFDAKWGRFNISSTSSGAANDFSITASDENGSNALTALGLQTKINKGDAAYKEYSLYAQYKRDIGDGKTEANSEAIKTINKLIQNDITSRTDAYFNEYKGLQSAIDATQKSIDAITKKYADKNPSETISSANIKNYQDALTKASTDYDDYKQNNASDPDYAEKLAKLQTELEAAREKVADAEALKTQEDNITNYKDRQAEIAGGTKSDGTTIAEGYISISNTGDSAAATTTLTDEIQKRYNDKAAYAATVIDETGVIDESALGLPSDPNKMASKVAGQDAEIYLNGAKYTNKDNAFEINGLTITALEETKAGEEITITTQRDTDGIYDMVKNFLKEYNEIVNEMDKLYNAASSKGYEPLTDEEKDAMSEKEVEKWETKIKDSILRRDDNLSSINSALQTIMASGFNVNGKTMYLYDFGIETLGYFESPDNEKHAYHIAGDPDDEYTMNSADKLKSMISNDPDTVISFFSQLSRGLYDKMSDMSKSVEGYRSFGNFYDDKKMKSDYDSYTSKIKEMETKLNEYEDKWYKKFSKMETALAKMQSNMSAVTGLLGG